MQHMPDPAAQQAIESAARLHAAGRFDQAERLCRQALSADPDSSAALELMGVLAGRAGRTAEAIGHFRRAAQLKPDSAQIHYNLGKALRDQKELEPAAESFRRAVELQPDLAPAWNNLGNTYRDLGRLEEAVQSFEQSLRLRPSHAPTLHNLGLAFRDLMRLDDAMRCFDTALTFDPSHHECRMSRAMLLLLRGDFEHGWSEYEARNEIPRAVARRDYPQPLWDGLDPRGRTILLHAEQGFGDTIQFARYAPLLASRGARVIVECQPELKDLFKSLKGIDRVVAAGDDLPQFDFHRGLMSMPMVFGTTLQTIPAEVPYLSADRLRIAEWNRRMGNGGGRVGLVWAGASGYMNDRIRSLALDQLAPLSRAANVTFVSLQKGPAARQAASPPQDMRLIDIGPHLHDFSDTAAALENLDLVICVDTAVGHLAGALGKPVWLMIPFSPDWRWMIDRNDTPWYPTMRLYRQPVPADWDAVIQQVATELEFLAL